jgi:16S rRNA (guanine527-N7)-methyltransferase
MEQQERIERFRDLLRAWGRKVNLIGPEAFAHLDEHVLEAVAAARHLQPVGECLDFGSGGGLPAIPMAIVAGNAARFHLVESDVKKWSFLKRAVRECELNCVVHGDRLAAVLKRLPPQQRFTLVTSRAVGYPETWVPLLSDRLATGGRIGLFQGSPELPPSLSAFDIEVFALPRGSANYLVTFDVPRGTTGS